MTPINLVDPVTPDSPSQLPVIIGEPEDDDDSIVVIAVLVGIMAFVLVIVCAILFVKKCKKAKQKRVIV